MDVFIWFFIIIGLVLLGYLTICLIAALTLTKVGPHPQYESDPGAFGATFEHVNFLSRMDKLQVAAWYLPNPVAEKAIVLVHGRNASKQNAISGKLSELASEITNAGLAVLMIDLRAHGDSEGKRYMWGVKERWDVLGAVDFLLEKGFARGNIAVLGISLGGAAVIGAASQEDAIGAVIIESTFADLQTLIDPNWKSESGLPSLFLPGVYWIWQVRFGINLREIKPVREIVKIRQRPILILHSLSDETVDISHAYQFEAAAPESEFVIFTNCEHAELFRDQPGIYLDALLPFLSKTW